jgi:hypothetical protein
VGFTKPTRLENDNSGGVLIARDAASMHHSRATAMRAVLCQECVEQGMYDPVHVPAATMTVDVLTKWLTINDFAKHRAKLTQPARAGQGAGDQVNSAPALARAPSYSDPGSHLAATTSDSSVAGGVLLACVRCR